MLLLVLLVVLLACVACSLPNLPRSAHRGLSGSQRTTHERRRVQAGWGAIRVPLKASIRVPC